MFTKIIVFFNENRLKQKPALKNSRVALLLTLILSFSFSAFAAPPASLLEKSITTNNNLWADIIVSGKVTDSKGEPLQGATVYVKGDNGKATKTDADGRFSLSVPDNAVLVVSFVGYQSTSETVNCRQAKHKSCFFITIKSCRFISSK